MCDALSIYNKSRLLQKLYRMLEKTISFFCYYKTFQIMPSRSRLLLLLKKKSVTSHYIERKEFKNKIAAIYSDVIIFFCYSFKVSLTHI